MLLLLCVGAQLCQTLWTVAHQAPLSSEFSRQEYWNGCHFILQRISPTQELNLNFFCLLHWQVDSFSVHHLRSPNYWIKPIKSSNLLRVFGFVFVFILGFSFFNIFSAPRAITHILFPMVTIVEKKLFPSSFLGFWLIKPLKWQKID